MSLADTLLEIGTWLATPIFINSFIEIDYWSIVHFIFGMLIIIGLFKYKSLRKYRKSPLRFALVLMILYEIGEVIIWSNPEIFNNIIPMPENPLNFWWDIIIGMLGSWVQLRRRK